MEAESLQMPDFSLINFLQIWTGVSYDNLVTVDGLDDGIVIGDGIVSRGNDLGKLWSVTQTIVMAIFF